MKIRLPVAVALIICLQLSEGTNTPILPSDYQDVIKQGFSTNWFKTSDPLSKYNAQNIDDVYARGFRNLRLRCNAELYKAPYTDSAFDDFLTSLATVVDKCIQVGVTPIISWIHHQDEAFATEQARLNYVAWWTKVATHLKDRSYNLSFNLFTELGIDGCGNNCSESLRENTAAYNQWTKDVASAIRKSGGKNAQRILILGSPKKTAKDLDQIYPTIYANDDYMMAEWHIYASGPNKVDGSQKYWSGDGSPLGRKNVETNIQYATNFTQTSKLATYLGAWMPTDNKDGALDEGEVISFAQYFAQKLKEQGVPWSLNVLDRYYDTANNEWLKDPQDIKGALIDMNKVLDKIKSVM
ncbi:predicted protein [Nematostella vectensis]|uniref:Glycoside hydrolase family 5 domain-containing protein n=1 Tax=Nematostella vectensis TaxID=45351 RepID=A7S5R8_NEMVE|nr:predicted protein [Nematostella vectensis]|eukprot:XP_001633015.1 predicted protein [Nematostella vectensis]